MKLLPFSLLAISTFFTALAGCPEINPSLVDAFILKSMENYEVPGLAIAVIKDDEILFMKGYGVVEIGSNEYVTPHTVFPISSCTKAITAAALGTLVDDGIVKWDNPVADYLDNFNLADPEVQKQITLADMLSHRSGLDSGNFLWYGTYFDRSNLMGKMHLLKVISTFRESFNYNNLLYLAAGEVIPNMTGMSWDAYLVQRMFIPLEMYESGTVYDDFAHARSLAIPHLRTATGVRSFPHHNVDQIGPAGTVVSTANDMSHWVRMNLNNGMYSNRRILSVSTIEAMQTSLINKGNDGYGLGWDIGEYHGYKLVSHNGYLDGTTARVALLPEKKIGVVILANLQFCPISQVLTNTVFDQLLGKTYHDWTQDFPKLPFNERKVEKSWDVSSSELEKYVGSYHSEIYGIVEIALEEGSLNFHQDKLFGELIPIGKDKFAFNPPWDYVYAEVREIEFKAENDVAITFSDNILGTTFSKR